MNTSLVPANTKKSTLILGMLRPYPDLAIAIGGTSITIISLLIFGTNAPLWLLILCLLPMLLAALLVFPIPNYHNTLGAFESILNFYQGRKKYIWRGWCLRREYENQK